MWKALKDEKYFFIEEDKGRNRYLGMSEEKIIDGGTGTLSPSPYIITSAINGSISTPKYGDLFDFDIFNLFNAFSSGGKYGYLSGTEDLNDDIFFSLLIKQEAP